MKTRLLFFIFFGSFISVSSQLSNKLIWASGTFYPKTIKGINPSKVGNFYTSIEQDKSKTEIVKYDYKTNKKVATLFSNISFKKFEFSDSALGRHVCLNQVSRAISR